MKGRTFMGYDEEGVAMYSLNFKERLTIRIVFFLLIVAYALGCALVKNKIDENIDARIDQGILV